MCYVTLMPMIINVEVTKQGTETPASLIPQILKKMQGGRYREKSAQNTLCETRPISSHAKKTRAQAYRTFYGTGTTPQIRKAELKNSAKARSILCYIYD